MTETMRLVRFDVLGEPSVLRVTEAPRPVPGKLEVLVEVRATGVNPVDWKVRRHGYWFTPPLTPGWDISGVVAAVGPGVTRFAVGDDVYGMPAFPSAASGYAEYVLAPSRHLARKPANLSHVEAAALPLAGLTAWQALAQTAKVGAGQRVLVHAAAGGVGHLALQIVKSLGGYAIGTARAEKHPVLKGLGADELIDYSTTDFAEVVRDVDVVLDTIGGDYEGRSFRVLRPGGFLVSVANPFGAEELAAQAKASGVRAAALMVEPDYAALQELTALAEKGALRPIVAGTFPLADAARAHEVGERNQTTGKLVLTV
jgi:NADPH:quinone reductase-like Zn-dependent oxidoreductase